MDKKMNVLLINPPNTASARISTGWDIEIDNIGSFPPYGLISLAAYARAKGGYNVKIVDCIAEKAGYEELAAVVKGFEPLVIGIGAFTYTFYDVLKTARMIRSILPEVHICIGGPHTTLFPKETLTHSEFDSLVLGEGEIPFLRLLDSVRDHKEARGIYGVLTKDTGLKAELEINCHEKLDELPFPAYDLLNLDLYSGTLSKHDKMLCICSSRGCPYSCTFCQVLVKKYRMFTIKYILDMIKLYYDKGYREFYFFDDLFNITPDRVIEFSQAVIESNLNINWVFRGRADKMNDKMLSLAAKAGCTHVLLGVEDYNNEGLRMIEKKVTVEQVKDSIVLAHKYGIVVSTNWIIGLPNHKTKDDIKNLVKTSIDVGSDYAQYTVLQLLPGCKMYDDAVNEGIIKRNTWSDFVLNPVPEFLIEPYEKYFSIKELSELYKYCYDRFYKRVAYIFTRMIKIKSFHELKRMIKPALKILFG